jgi:dienelactone hydrolase
MLRIMSHGRSFISFAIVFLYLGLYCSPAADYALPVKTSGDRFLVEHFRRETAGLADRCLTDIKSLEDWNARRETYRRQLFEMLSLDPMPPRSELQAVVTGRVERDDFAVENLHFQSRPGLYVTANLYLPKNLSRPAPTILYLSGHGPVISNGVSYGNKVTYQHHGAWFARNGFLCLVLDTLQLGEIPGLHHGTHREGMWWWNARGYTPAGVEAWNCIRALDYLSTRPEVDTNRFGATGRSGGGAYSWWIAALDDRIKAAAPVAGITDLRNHVVDGVVEGHCDCMFTVNTYRWDYPQVAALVAPRPLLIVNTDADYIFPLDGVQRTHALVRRIYELHKASDKLGLVIGPGPHKDTQDLQLPVFRWFNRHLKGEDPVIEMAAVKLLKPEQLKVFATLPADSINTNIQETFVPVAPVPALPKHKDEWARQRDGWLAALKEKCFAGWPEERRPLNLERKYSITREEMTFEAFDFDSEPGVRLRLYSLRPAELKAPALVSLEAMTESSWTKLKEAWQPYVRDEFMTEGVGLAGPPGDEDKRLFNETREVMKTGKMMFHLVAPRGIGPTAWSADSRKQVQIRRRCMLLGQTLEAMRVWDIRRACQAMRALPERRATLTALDGTGSMAVNVVYASLFEAGITDLVLHSPPRTHRAGPDYLNVLRVLDVPQAVAMAVERSSVRIISEDTAGWDFPAKVADHLEWDKARFVVQPPPVDSK